MLYKCYLGYIWMLSTILCPAVNYRQFRQTDGGAYRINLVRQT